MAATSDSESGPASLLVIGTAEFSQDDGLTWTAVALPDTWAQRGLGGLGKARYRIRFELTQVPTDPWAVVLSRISTFHLVRLNGKALATQGDTPSYVNRRTPAAALFDLPAALLQRGSNELEIDLRYKWRSGLSGVELGPTGLAYERLEHTLILDETLPRALNMATAGLAIFMLAIWWRRRAEVALGAFGAMMLVAALRNYTYSGTYIFMPPWLFDWMIFSSQVATTVLLGAFAQSLAGGWRPYRMLLILVAIGFPAIAAMATFLDHSQLASRLQGGMATDRIDLLRRLLYPMLALTSLTGLALLARQAWRARGPKLIAPLMGVVVLIASGWHDYAFQIGRLPVTDRFWLPVTVPLVMSGLAMLLVARLVVAINTVEALNIELDQRVALRTRELEQANAAKSRFLAAATHDLRQPVVTVSLLLGMAQDAMQHTASPARHLIERARSALDALEALLRDLLDLSRIESGGHAPVLQTVSIAALFRSIETHARISAQEKGLSIKFRPTGLSVHSDPVLLEQILRNLVDNAVRYTERGGVLVSARPRGQDAVLLQVRDTGRGIAPEHQRAIFEEFVRVAPNAHSAPTSTGLGLAIVRRATAALGMTLTLESRAGRGSCFSMCCGRALIEPAADCTGPCPGP